MHVASFGEGQYQALEPGHRTLNFANAISEGDPVRTYFQPFLDGPETVNRAFGSAYQFLL